MHNEAVSEVGIDELDGELDGDETNRSNSRRYDLESRRDELRR